MEYFEKLLENPYKDLYWNLPEKKQGVVNVIGGNARSFQSEVKTAEFLMRNYAMEKVEVVLPEALKKQLPELENLRFLPATETGAFTGEGMLSVMERADYNLLLGDFSKNSITGQAVGKCVAEAKKPILVTRDAVDLVAENQPEKVLMNPGVGFLASLAQLKKLMGAVYYPRMLLLTAPLMQVAEVLHKFTLSYEVGVVTFCGGQIMVAKNGKVQAVALENTGYTPITLWNGEVAAKLVALNLYNPQDFVGASVAALWTER